jgi:hypothetical protein
VAPYFHGAQFDVKVYLVVDRTPREVRRLGHSDDVPSTAFDLPNGHNPTGSVRGAEADEAANAEELNGRRCDEVVERHGWRSVLLGLHFTFYEVQRMCNSWRCHRIKCLNAQKIRIK